MSAWACAAQERNFKDLSQSKLLSYSFGLLAAHCNQSDFFPPFVKVELLADGLR